MGVIVIIEIGPDLIRRSSMSGTPPILQANDKIVLLDASVLRSKGENAHSTPVRHDFQRSVAATPMQEYLARVITGGTKENKSCKFCQVSRRIG